MSDDGLHPDPFLVLDPGRHTAAIKRLDADREGRFLVTASDDKTVRVWAAADGRLLRTLRLPAGPGNVGKAYAAAISPDGTLVAAGGWTAPVGTTRASTSSTGRAGGCGTGSAGCRTSSTTSPSRPTAAGSRPRSAAAASA